MNRSLKALSLALLAIAVSGAALATSASAHQFFVPKPPAFVTSDIPAPHKFATVAGTVECQAAEFAGTAATELSTKLTLTPFYDECTFGGDEALVEMNDCDYKLSSETSVDHGPLTLECKEVVEIFVESVGCNITIAPQTAATGVTYIEDSTTGGADVTATITTVFAVKADGPFFPCAFVGNSAVYTGIATLTGYEDNNGKEGNRIDFKFNKT